MTFLQHVFTPLAAKHWCGAGFKRTAVVQMKNDWEEEEGELIEN